MGEKPRGSDESGPDRSPLPASFPDARGAVLAVRGGRSEAEPVTPLGLEAVRRILSTATSPI